MVNSGFLVGSQQVQENGLLGHNAKAGTRQDQTPLGRTYFLSALMSQSNGSTLFTDSGIATAGDDVAYPIVRGVLMAASGIVLGLSNSIDANQAPSGDKAAFGAFATSKDAGSSFGHVNLQCM